MVRVMYTGNDLYCALIPLEFTISVAKINRNKDMNVEKRREQ